MSEEYFRNIFNTYDSINLLEKISALNLIFENQNKNVYFTYLTNYALFNQNTNRPKCSSKKFKEIVNEVQKISDLSLLIDPSESPFFEYVFYDTLKNDIQHIGDGEEIKKTATVLSNIAQKYKMFIGSTLQLLESTTAPINLTINDMAASRTVKEVLDTLCLFKQINNQSYADYEYSEIEESKQYKDIKAYEDPDVRYYACVVDKNRAGAKPKLLFKLNLAYNEWFELGHLRMKQKLK